MDNINVNRYHPDKVSPPGETLLETLRTIGMTQTELAVRMRRPAKTINEIIKGKAALTPETALQLERVLRIPASFWNQLETNYRDFCERANEKSNLRHFKSLISNFPIRAMAKLDWIKKEKDVIEQLRELMTYFGVSSPDALRNWCNRLVIQYRQSRAFQSNPESVAAWIRRGDILAQGICCPPFSGDSFRMNLKKIRSLTLEPNPDAFVPQLRDLCLSAGVIHLFVPELPGIRICGATRWLTPHKVLIQMSLRYKTNDHLWFTFFHEAGHILLHGKTSAFIDDESSFEDSGDDKEDEANKFASDFLIPRDEYRRFLQKRKYSCTEIVKFARTIGIAPGIVVGRLQHDRVIGYDKCNRLKVKYRWCSSE